MRQEDFAEIIQRYLDGLGPKIRIDPGDELFLWVVLAVKHNFDYVSFSNFYVEKNNTNLKLDEILNLYCLYFFSESELIFRQRIRNKISKEHVEALIFSIFLTGGRLEDFYLWIK